MKFEHALMEFLLKLKEEYGMQSMIKSIELDENFYRCVELDLMRKTQEIPPSYPSRLQFYYYNEDIHIKRSEQKE